MSPFNLSKINHLDLVKKYALVENSIILAFIIFGFVGILHHEIWRDEFQAWLLARDSASLIELFHNIQHEGHPGLWHLCLYGLSRITHNPLIMQVFHLFISVIIVTLIVKFSPFSPVQKFLLSFGYYFFYEYTIISRNYNLGVLFIFLFCIIYSRAKVRPILLATLLALMANVNVFTFILSFALSLTLVDHIYSQFKANKLNQQKIVISLLILISGWAISLFQIIRPLISQEKLIRPIQSSAEQVQSNPGLLQEIQRLGTAFIDIWRSYVPIPFHLNNNFWNTNILIHNNLFPSVGGVSLGVVIAGLAAIFLLLIVIKIFSHKRFILTIYLFGTGSIIAFNYLIFQGVMRHRGHLFILLIACLWIIEKEFLQKQNFISEPKLKSQFRNQFFTLILLLHLVGGLHAYSVDLFYPFSMGKETAQFIKENNLEQLTIVGQRYRQASVLSGYLDKQIYYPDLGEFGSFWTVKTPMKNIKIIEGLIRENPNNTLLVLTYPLQSDSTFPPDIKITELKRFVKPTIENFERSFYVYTARSNRQS